MVSNAVRETLDTLNNLKPNTTIALSVDLANENLNSICCIAAAWISGGNVRGIYYYAKPPTDNFSASRKVTAAMVQDSDTFDVVWDRDIRPLLRNPTLSAYKAEPLFMTIKASYEHSGKSFADCDFFIRDLSILSRTYLPNLGNDSLLSITHKMDINVDLDSCLSRAMACVCAVDWIQSAYPVNDYGIPLAMIMGLTLDANTKKTHRGFYLEKNPSQATRNPYIFRNPYIGLGVFLIVSAISMGYYMFMQNELINTTPSSIVEQASPPVYDTNKTYYMESGTYIILDEKDLNSIHSTSKEKVQDILRTMVKEGKVIIFSARTAVKVTGKPLDNGFVPVTIADGSSTRASGYAPFQMIETK
ncbi:MAG: hypothetical protein LKI76_09440 [Megasphaera sp.]|jgi:hypothetical protein|uniref:hypothetical protein n=1 Tax=Megasphaera sueciensis TaxID=349094 RepID=UPI003CFE2952|nr:hypothetical protein [Megasphaera sp.]